jgi:hypothetical protein
MARDGEAIDMSPLELRPRRSVVDPVGARVPHHADLGVDPYQVRQFPRGTGATTLGVSRENRVVTEMTKTLMKGLGYRGVVDMNYRFDERDGQYKLLDVNAAGLDLPSLRGRRRLGHRSGGVPGSDRSAGPGLGDARRRRSEQTGRDSCRWGRVQAVRNAGSGAAGTRARVSTSASCSTVITARSEVIATAS